MRISHKRLTIRRVIADIRPQMLVIKNWTSRLDYIRARRDNPMPKIVFKMSETSVFAYNFDMAKKRILTQHEIDRFMNNSDESSEDGFEYSDDDVDFHQIVCPLMGIWIVTVKIVMVYEI
ncbi:hypothetical protein TNCV_984271 [Trichonephila clavipes]|nr:hypothetical protein TNCV_984271 [Trichonephila clavipes]